MKHAFDGLINEPDMDEERIIELEDVSIETPHTDNEWEKRNEIKGTDYLRTVKQLQKV